ncbi:MAG TPA: tetratricopeptide repeat protein [Chloroflexia bacterium]|nr:tetratricopeptide repeat protein [Chloroflexia bacterium]
MAEETSFGTWLKHYRRNLDLTQKDLAHDVGCSEITIRKIEADEYRPSKQLAGRLAECLRIPPGEQSAFLQFARGFGGVSKAPGSSSSTSQAPWREGSVVTEPPHPTNVQPPLTPTLGREEIIAEVAHLLAQDTVHLLTLVGAPGIGKTRLGTEVALRLLDNFEDGVFVVGLAAIRDPNLVGAAIAQALGLANVKGRGTLPDLIEALHDKHILLLLDNFEQVIVAAPLLTDLLASSPGLKIVVTSREALHLSREQVFWVPPLDLPNLTHLPMATELENYPAIALFVERSRAVKPGFALTEENAEAVATICARLDGLPLAIELAAARTRLLPPKALLSRLSSRLKVVVGGERDSPARHQTLRDAIAWSYDLLDEADRALFRRTGVFVGGCTLSAVEAVCNAYTDLEKDVLEGLESLLDKHLLHLAQEDGEEEETRLAMLETIREYALEELALQGEDDAIRYLHAEYYLAMAEAADLNLTGAEQKLWLDRLERDHDNLRAALQWLLQQGDAETAARLGVALRRFWEVHSHFNEGKVWLKQVLGQPASIPAPLRAKVLNGAGALALAQGDYQDAISMIEESLALQRQLGDAVGVVGALNNLGMVAIVTGDFEQALLLLDEGLVISRELGEKGRIATVLGNLAVAVHKIGDLERAEPLMEESLALRRELGHKRGVATALGSLAEISRARGEHEKTRTLFAEALALYNELKDRVGVAKALEGLAGMELAQAHLERAACLLGAVEAMLTSVGAPLATVEHPQHETVIADCRSMLGEETFNEAWARGQAMSAEEVISYALDQS